MVSLPARLAALRTAGCLGAAELGTLAGLSRGTVGMIESGRRPDPSASTVAALARVLGDKHGWLLSGIGAPPNEGHVAEAIAKARKASEPTDTDTPPAEPAEPQPEGDAA